MESWDVIEKDHHAVARLSAIDLLLSLRIRHKPVAQLLGGKRWVKPMRPAQKESIRGSKPALFGVIIFMS